MKSIFTTAFLIMMVVFFTAPSRILASSDTLVVYANGASLETIIGSDTTSSGAQAHKAYKLVSLDTTYVYFGAITVKSDFTVIGKLGTDGRPPCIQPGVLSDGSVPANLFVLNGVGIKGTFKNLYLLGISTSNTVNWADAIDLTADSIKLTVDNVIFEAWWTNAIGYSGNWDKFFITNCKFRNGAQPSWYSGEVLRNMTGSATTDSLVMKYNTILCVNAYAACPVTKTMVTYFEFSHNSVIWMFKNPFWIFNVTNAKVNNNIFYGTWAGGQSLAEYPWWDQLWSAEIGSIIDLDTLDAAKAAIFDPADAGNSNIRMLADAKRIVEVKNNVYFTPSQLSNYITAWNDTSHVDSIITNKWMNARTTNMFADKTHWPGLTESGTKNVDPGFGSSILNVLNNNQGNGVGLLEYIKEIRTSVATPGYYGYQRTQVGSAANWVPTWPLPEATDMKYSNTALKTSGTDGLPIGDPGWFMGGYTGVVKTSTQVPTTFSLSNAYPNPFNPTTNIAFTVAKSENVKLVVFNILGQQIKTLVNGEMKAGNYTATWNGKDEFGTSVASGIYFYRLESQSFNSTKKMILMK